MKKFYSLLAMLLMASATFAQTLSVTIGGKAVNNGDVVEIPLESAWHWIIPNVIGNANIDPEIVIKSTIAQDVSVTVTDLDQEDGTLQNCFAGGCLPVMGPNWSETKTASVPAGDTNSGIDLVYGANDPGSIIRSFSAAISNASEKIEFTVKYYIGTYASVMSVEAAGNAKAAAYSLSGVKVDNETLPAGSIYVKDGKKFIKK